MSEITVANGWYQILAEAIDEAATLPEDWCFEIVRVTRAPDGSLKLDAQYNPFDVPWDESVPHPWRAWQRIKRKAQERSLVTCECCGRPGKSVGAVPDARVRCPAHVDVVDAVEWSGDPVGFMFDSAEEALAHFLQDYGAGLDVMQELQAAADEDSDVEEGDPETRH